MNTLFKKMPLCLIVVLAAAMFVMTGCGGGGGGGVAAGPVPGPSAEVPVTLFGTVSDTNPGAGGAPDRLAAPLAGYLVMAKNALTGETLSGGETLSDANGNFTLSFKIPVTEDYTVVLVAQDPQDVSGATVMRAILAMSAADMQTLIGKYNGHPVIFGSISPSSEELVKNVEQALGLSSGSLGREVVTMTYKQIDEEAAKWFPLIDVNVTVQGLVSGGTGGGVTHLAQVASVNATGNAGDGVSKNPSISQTGLLVAFDSEATNLVADDPNGLSDVYLRDFQVGETILISVAIDGGPADGNSLQPSLASVDGGFVAFESDATNLVPEDLNGFSDVFVRDTVFGDTFIVSVDDNGNQGDGDSRSASISADGIMVAFESDATNLVGDDINGVTDVFISDGLAVTTTRVSISSTGEESNGPSYAPAISGNGLVVAFVSQADNLVNNDTNETDDIFVYDLDTGTTEMVNVAGGGVTTELGSFSGSPAINFDGRYVAFVSDSVNLGGTGAYQIFVYDRELGQLTLVSVNQSGEPANGDCLSPSISDDGRFVVFVSTATNLVTQNTEGFSQIYIHDLRTGVTSLVSFQLLGGEVVVPGNNSSIRPRISGDGTSVTGSSDATNLITLDNNGASQIVLW